MEDALFALITRVSTHLPDDIQNALKQSLATAEGNASRVLSEIVQNCRMSAEGQVPICQDTGIPCFRVTGPGLDHQWCRDFEENARRAVRRAVAAGILRSNAADAVTGQNNGDCTGSGIPQIYFVPRDSGPVSIELLLKGGGSENVSCQYSLPDQSIGAGRDMDGVRRCILDAVFKAQGRGCAPGILGVCVGGDRGSGYMNAKMQLFRRLDEDVREKDPRFAALEDDLVPQINSLGIGPMGMGGSPTVLGVKICTVDRHPASFFVTVSCGCWATRRGSMKIDPGKGRFDF